MRRAPLLAALTGVAVLLTGGALLVVPGEPAPRSADRPPTTTALTRQQLLCPAGGDGVVGSTRASGSVGVGLGADAPDVADVADVAVRRLATTEVSQRPPYAVDGRRDLAPGLVASVGDARQGSAAACLPPAPDAWFTGVGAGSLHASTLQLVNPDASAAVAEIALLGPRGPVDAGPIRSVTVPGGTATTVDLPARVPTRSELAVHVTVVRGRLGAAVSDTLSDLSTTTDWLPAQAEPAERSVLLGLAASVTSSTTSSTTSPPGDSPDRRTLVLANPGEDQAAVQLQVVDDESTFTPTGVDPVEVPAQSVVALSLPPAIARAVAGGEAGILVDADRPVTATLRSRTDGDLSHATGGAGFTEAALLVPALPGATTTLTLAAPDTAGAAVVTAYDATGRRLGRQRVGVRRLTETQTALPARTALVTVRTTGTALAGAVRVVSGARVFTLPLTPLATSALVPAVAPAPPGRAASRPQSSGR